MALTKAIIFFCVVRSCADIIHLDEVVPQEIKLLNKGFSIPFRISMYNNYRRSAQLSEIVECRVEGKLRRYYVRWKGKYGLKNELTWYTYSKGLRRITWHSIVSKDFKDVPAYYNKSSMYKICCCKRRRKIENIAYYY